VFEVLNIIFIIIIIININTIISIKLNLIATSILKSDKVQLKLNNKM